MLPHSQTLFHYTATIETVKLILQNGLRFSRLTEELPLSGYASNIFDQLPGFVKHVQFREGVCLCDITPEAAEAHRTEYGRFGLGFSKQWAMNIGASPVRYVHRRSPDIGSELFTTILDLPQEIRTRGSIYGMMAQMRGLDPLDLDRMQEGHQRILRDVEELCNRLLDFCDFSASYLRVHDGIWTDRVSGEDTHRTFYDENEWRIVRSHGHGDYIMFTADDLSCVLVETAEQRDEIIAHVDGLCSMLGTDKAQEFLSKIMTYDEVLATPNRFS